MGVEEKEKPFYIRSIIASASLQVPIIYLITFLFLLTVFMGTIAARCITA